MKTSYIPLGLTDATPTVRQALQDGASRLVFEPGRYDFWPLRASEHFLFVSNNDAGLKRIAFCLDGLEEIEIDGGGSEFFFHGGTLPFLVRDCRNVRLHHFSFDWERPFHAEALVVDADKRGALLLIDPQFPFAVQQNRLLFTGGNGPSPEINNLLEFDTARRETAFDARDNYGIGVRHSARLIGPHLVRFDAQLSAIPRVGNTLAFTMQGCRHFPGLVLTGSRGVALHDVTIHHAGGMGVIAQHCEDLTLSRVQVKARKGSGRLISTVADATHFVNCRGTVILEECHFENQLDDATNVHGTYGRIEERLGQRSIEVSLQHPQQWGFGLARSGEHLQFIHNDTLQPYFEAKLAHVESVNRQFLHLTFEETLPDALSKGDAVMNLDWVASVTIRGCTARGNRARGFLLSTAGHILVENNHIHTPGAAIQIAGDANFWFESGPVQNVTIRGNTFDSCLYGVWSKATIEINPEIHPEFRIEPHYHRGITIVDNRFLAFDGRLIAAHGVDGLTIGSNSVEFSPHYPQRHWQTEPFEVKDCSHVEICDNSFPISTEAPLQNDTELTSQVKSLHPNSLAA